MYGITMMRAVEKVAGETILMIAGPPDAAIVNQSTTILIMTILITSPMKISL